MPKLPFRRRLFPPLGVLRHPRKAFNARRWYPSRYFSQQPKPEEGVEPPSSIGPAHARMPLRRRLVAAWKDTPTKWYPLPVGIGALLLAILQWRKTSQREPADAEDVTHEQPVKVKGRWKVPYFLFFQSSSKANFLLAQVTVLGALPLRNLSRVWGYLNSFELPMWFRPAGLSFYAWVFGCNLEEIEYSDLTMYPSLGEFFYRKLKPDVRPIANAALVSPADGTVLHFGKIVNSRVEQVKGLTYSLDALLGGAQSHGESITVDFAHRQGAEVDDEEFADVNGIEYSLNQLLGSNAKDPLSLSLPSSSPPVVASPSLSTRPSPLPSSSVSSSTPSNEREGPIEDASVPTESSQAHSLTVAAEMGSSTSPSSLKRTNSVSNVKPGNELFFIVVYLAPGDYHRFHSPTAWVVEKRRHFAGELFSVAPWMAKQLQNLFVLNERVALLGRWRHGFFGMVPVGATNVGSIKINFDEALRTNVRRHRVSPGSFNEATYANASAILSGQPLRAGQEMGGFRLGSTIVLVFEAPPTFTFDVEVGKKVKVGEKIGDIPPMV
ncbi:hypothetical protein BS47DRAFT_1382229 [Hydnum rufescens UP504]|uniref:Phosphatidylserine decarboxylase proenzyme 1, mitochondrial n=1 Tax=Hydnum rufescens UP504 TaxID=1448309 RepID=A0A9P6DT45_9AGAM|nr:hypothetical protein BS47DRAFT_1382229 [Hydnum rufescens UP504]